MFKNNLLVPFFFRKKKKTVKLRVRSSEYQFSLHVMHNTIFLMATPRFLINEDTIPWLTTIFTEVVIMIITIFFSRSRSDFVSSRKRRFSFGQFGPKPSKQDFSLSWLPRMYFATFPVSTLGNWIPRVLSQWYCSGHGCGFDQIVIENAQGKPDERSH